MKIYQKVSSYLLQRSRITLPYRNPHAKKEWQNAAYRGIVYLLQLFYKTVLFIVKALYSNVEKVQPCESEIHVYDQ